jgi:hyperosmotically inducible periplasmic protein
MKNAFAGRLVFVGTLLLGLAACAGSGEKTGVYVDDSTITSKVKSEMVADKSVSGRNISVNTTHGIVTLTGTAATAQESNRAAAIAHGVAGVKAVENDIRVQ